MNGTLKPSVVPPQLHQPRQFVRTYCSVDKAEERIAGLLNDGYVVEHMVAMNGALVVVYATQEQSS